MTSIISRELIRSRARAAFHAGRSRDDHNMNWNAAALPTWLAEFDRLANSIPPLHGAPAKLARLDLRQGRV